MQMPRTHSCLAAPLILALSLGTGCQSPQGGDSDSAHVVQIGTTRAGLFGLPPEYAALQPRLEQYVGAQVRFIAQPNGAALGTQLAQGNIAFALMTAKEYAEIQDPSSLKIIASAMNSTGQTGHKALIFAKKSDARIKGIPDCKGKRFAFGGFGDLLTDTAAKRALETGGCPPADILVDLAPPPYGILGRLYVGKDAAKTIAFDLTVNAGVVDELDYAALPDSGGNLITGPSKDLLTQIGETEPVPELALVAGPSADAEMTGHMKNFFINEVKTDADIKKQLAVAGFAEADRANYDHVRQWVAKPADSKSAESSTAASDQ